MKKYSKNLFFYYKIEHLHLARSDPKPHIIPAKGHSIDALFIIMIMWAWVETERFY